MYSRPRLELLEYNFFDIRSCLPPWLPWPRGPGIESRQRKTYTNTNVNVTKKCKIECVPGKCNFTSPYLKLETGKSSDLHMYSEIMFNFQSQKALYNNTPVSGYPDLEARKMEIHLFGVRILSQTQYPDIESPDFEAVRILSLW